MEDAAVAFAAGGGLIRGIEALEAGVPKGAGGCARSAPAGPARSARWWPDSISAIPVARTMPGAPGAGGERSEPALRSRRAGGSNPQIHEERQVVGGRARRAAWHFGMQCLDPFAKDMVNAQHRPARRESGLRPVLRWQSALRIAQASGQPLIGPRAQARR